MMKRDVHDSIRNCSLTNQSVAHCQRLLLSGAAGGVDLAVFDSPQPKTRWRTLGSSMLRSFSFVSLHIRGDN